MSSAILLLRFLVLVGVSSGAPSAQDQLRIVGGRISANSKWPYFAGLFNWRLNPDAPLCGTVIWDKDTVLTAAHCIASYQYDNSRFGPPSDPGEFSVFVGHNDWTGVQNPDFLFKAKEVIIHPGFIMGSFSNDIAVIRLERSIDFDALNQMNVGLVQCACDPEPLHLVDTNECIAMGWGMDNSGRVRRELMEVNLPILPYSVCAEYEPQFDPTSHFCAGYIQQQCIGICHGDSGGPFVCPLRSDPTKYSLVGVTSYGKSPPLCGHCSPSYFTNVLFYLDWIRQTTVSFETTTISWWLDVWRGPIHKDLSAQR